ncbi:hypothetical protein FNI11_13395 [Salmonella enterica subsp. salamae]|nr:hypothetical protein [Salmonella enterica subsp. salamae]ECJ2281348.1 hypothetical protein [Salmonella enterica subsp. salamae]
MQDINNEIDLIDVALFLVNKWVSIVATTLFFVAMGYVFVSVQNDIKVVNIKIRSNLDTPATYALCGYDNDIQCKSTVILNQFSRFLPVEDKNKMRFDGKNQLILFTDQGKDESISDIATMLGNSVDKMAAWYIADGDIKRYSLNNDMLQTETYAKLSLLSDAVKNNVNVEVIDISVMPKYKMRWVLSLCLLMGVMFSITGLLCQRALTEYQLRQKWLKSTAREIAQR